MSKLCCSFKISMSRKLKIFLLLISGGIITGLSVTFSKYFGPLEWVSLIPVVIAVRMLCDGEGTKLRHAYLFGLFYFEIFYATCFHWFTSLYPLDFTGLNNFYSVLVIFVAWFGLSLLQALFGGLVFVICVMISRTTIAKKFSAVNLLSFTTVYTFYEFTQTLGWWGVPWGRLSLGQVDGKYYAQAASLFGSYFVTAIVLLVNSLLAFGILSFKNNSRSERTYALSALGVYLLNLVLGITLYYGEAGRIKDADKVNVGVIQGNFSSTEKWNNTADNIFNRYLELTEKAAEDGAELIIWPETALPFSYREGGYYCTLLADVAKKWGVTLMVGTIDASLELDRNAVICYTPDGERSENIYAKRHLVPFGEYVPMRAFIEVCLPFLAEISVFDDDWIPGEDSAIFNTDAGNVGSLICFDSIYEAIAIDSARDGAELFALSTNDSWFSDSAALYMHNNQARLRAIENRRFIARSANTGLSSFISSSGDVLSTLPISECGYLNCELSLLSHKTLYTRIGNVFVYTMGVMAISPLVYEAVLKIKKRFSAQKENNHLQNGEQL